MDFPRIVAITLVLVASLVILTAEEQSPTGEVITLPFPFSTPTASVSATTTTLAAAKTTTTLAPFRDLPSPPSTENTRIQTAQSNVVFSNYGWNACLPAEAKEKADAIWEYYQQPRFGARKLPYFENTVYLYGNTQNAQLYYEMQVALTPVVYEAELCHDTNTLDAVAKVLRKALKTVTITQASDGTRYYVFVHRDTDNNQLIEDPFHEEIIHSSQFVFLLARTMNAIANTPAQERTQDMTLFANEAVPIVVNNLYRWEIAEKQFTYGWPNNAACPGKNNYLGFVQCLVTKNSWNDPKYEYHKAVLDSLLWMAASNSEVLDASTKDSQLIRISTLNKERLKSFLDPARSLISSRFTYVSVSDFQGNPAVAAQFDAGVWDKHPEFGYSAYTSMNFPNAANDKHPSLKASFDASHGGRLNYVLASLKKTRTNNFPSDVVLERFANNFAYNMFNKNLQQPKFSNFLSGELGWYRVFYGGSTTFGYRPYSLGGESAYSAGYFTLSEHNSDLLPIADELYAQIMLNEADPFQEEMLEHRKEYFEATPTRPDTHSQNYDPSRFDQSKSFMIMKFIYALARSPR